MLWNQSILQAQPKYGSILFDAPMYVRQNATEGAKKLPDPKKLASLRADFRKMVLRVTSGTTSAASVGGSLDVTQLFAGFAARYLNAMKRKAGAKAAHKSLKLSQINQSEKYRGHFLTFLKVSYAADGLVDFLNSNSK